MFPPCGRTRERRRQKQRKKPEKKHGLASTAPWASPSSCPWAQRHPSPYNKIPSLLKLVGTRFLSLTTDTFLKHTYKDTELLKNIYRKKDEENITIIVIDFFLLYFLNFL